MKMLFSGLVLLCASSSAFAGGSASKEEILSLIAIDMAAYVDHFYDLADSGTCVKVDNRLPTGNQRILPCTIDGVFKKNGNRVTITFEVDDTFSEVVRR